MSHMCWKWDGNSPCSFIRSKSPSSFFVSKAHRLGHICGARPCNVFIGGRGMSLHAGHLLFFVSTSLHLQLQLQLQQEGGEKLLKHVMEADPDKSEGTSTPLRQHRFTAKTKRFWSHSQFCFVSMSS
jgi:hypothetical protein